MTGTSSGVPLLDHYTRSGTDPSSPNIGYREPAYRDINRPEWTKSSRELLDEQFYGTGRNSAPPSAGGGTLPDQPISQNEKTKITAKQWFWIIGFFLVLMELLMKLD